MAKNQKGFEAKNVKNGKSIPRDKFISAPPNNNPKPIVEKKPK
jgi:hypothetical protein